jgi:hypothetical protein
MFSFQLVSIATAFVLNILGCSSPMPRHPITLWRTSVVWSAAKCHGQAAGFLRHIYLNNLYTLLNRIEYTITKERVFLFPC